MADELNRTGKEKTVQETVNGIGEEQLKTAQETFKKYREGRKNLDDRIIKNENWWRTNHWSNFESQTKNGIKPRSAWLFNSINNKHADFMDNFPAPNVLPREQSDEATADSLSTVLPVILEQCDFEYVYSLNTTDKLKNGVAVYGVYFNPLKADGLGDIDIKPVDILNFYWEPGVQDIQESENIFVSTIMSNKKLKMLYPDVLGADFDGGGNIEQSKYSFDDNVDNTGKSQVVDWYYKLNVDGKDVLHYVKYVGEHILFASQNDSSYSAGFYEHGLYPFVMDVLFPLKGTPAGFGYIDIMTSPQEYIDKLGGAILENSLWGSKPRFFIKEDMDINEAELANLDNAFVKVAGNSLDESRLRPIEYSPVHGNYLTVMQQKIDELKETSGNRDFSQGSTTAGVTAASAIAALQEAGSKTSRDMIKGSYRAYTKICNMCIELIRQFYDTARVFRITGDDGSTQYTELDNKPLLPGADTNDFGIDFSERVPIFDIKVKAQKSSPYAREAQNELALAFFDRGFFNPDYAHMALACLEMMEFEGKEKVKDMIRQNSEALMQQQAMQQEAMAMAQEQQNAAIEESLPDTQGTGELVDTDTRLGGVRARANSTTEVR